jgi:hypothetical protein
MWTFSVSVSGGSNVGHQLCVSASCRRLSCLSVLLILKTGEAERALDSEVLLYRVARLF